MLKKAFIKTDCQNSQLTTKFRNFTNKSWGSRWEKQTVLMNSFLSVHSHWPSWPLSVNVRHPWGVYSGEKWWRSYLMFFVEVVFTKWMCLCGSSHLLWVHSPSHPHHFEKLVYTTSVKMFPAFEFLSSIPSRQSCRTEQKSESAQLARGSVG